MRDDDLILMAHILRRLAMDPGGVAYIIQHPTEPTLIVDSVVTVSLREAEALKRAGVPDV